jgi:hypothetical protein
MTTPDFNDLTPPYELVCEWSKPSRGKLSLAQDIAHQAARWGARHGWEQARQLWPEPITDRPPTEADGDDQGWVMVFSDGVWRPWAWRQVAFKGWLHTPRWQPRQPTLKEIALQFLGTIEKDQHYLPEITDAIRRALEQAGEGVE